MSQGTRIRVEEYNKIKMFLTEGVPKATVNKITGRSYQTLKLIELSTSFENYVHLQMVKNGYIDADGNRINKYDHVTKKPKVVTEPEATKPETDYHVTSSADQIVTSLNNLTEAVITMTAVLNKLSTQEVQKKKLFFN